VTGENASAGLPIPSGGSRRHFRAPESATPSVSGCFPLVVKSLLFARALQAKQGETLDGHGAKQVERLLAEAERVHAHGANDRDPAWAAIAHQLTADGLAHGSVRPISPASRTP
jgi:hypothetical protein